jgi:peptidoglycan hydrolase CwlO-like protein
MSKITVLAALNKIKNKLQTQRAEADTDITNLKVKIDEKKALKDQLTADILQLNQDIADVTNGVLQ